MNKLACLLALTSILVGAPVLAYPILSVDGTSLTGVTVSGYGIYDVTFGDGIVGDTYSDVIFDADRKAEADALSIGIVDALNLIGAGAYDIAGCGPNQVYVYCILFNPDRLESGGTVLADDADAIGRLNFDPIWDRYTEGGLNLPLGINTAFDNSTTLVTSYTPSSVPTPSPLAMILLGLGLFALNRRKPLLSQR